jgi:O-antigen ligase
MGERNSLVLASFLLVVRYLIEPFHIAVDKDLRKAVGVFIGTVFLVCFFSSQPINSFRQLAITIISFTPLILVAAIIKHKKQLYILFAMLAISVIGGDCYAIWQGVHGNLRASAFSDNPMHLAGILVQVIPLFLILSLKAGYPAITRTVFFSISMLSTVALIFNATRGAWIAVVVTILLYAAIIARSSRRSLLVALTVLVIFGLIAVTVPETQARIRSIGDMNFQSNSERLLLWESAGKMFYDHPLVGVGFGQFKELYQSQYISPLAKEPNLPHAHNNVMQFLAETGIVGLTGFIYLFWTVLRRSYTLYAATLQEEQMVAIFLATIGLFIQGMTEYNFGDVQVTHMYWFIVALGYCSVLTKSEKQEL